MVSPFPGGASSGVSQHIRSFIGNLGYTILTCCRGNHGQGSAALEVTQGIIWLFNKPLGADSIPFSCLVLAPRSDFPLFGSFWMRGRGRAVPAGGAALSPHPFGMKISGIPPKTDAGLVLCPGWNHRRQILGIIYVLLRFCGENWSCGSSR